MSRSVELEIPAKPEFLSLARLVITGAATIEPTFSDERIEDLRIAVSEACTNAIEAHRISGVNERVVIKSDLGEDRIEVEIIDQGSGFDLGETDPAPDATAPNRLSYERGLGIPLMRVLVDETEFTVSPSGTTVRLVVSRPVNAVSGPE